MDNDRLAKFLLQKVLNGLIAQIGVNAHAVLMVIAAAIHGPIVSRLTLPEIAEMVGKSVETITSAIEKLKESHLINVERQGRNNTYRIVC